MFLTIPQILLGIFFIPGWLLYIAYQILLVTYQIILGVIDGLPWSLVGVGIFVFFAACYLIPGFSHIPSIIVGTMLQLTAIALTIFSTVVNLAIAAITNWAIGPWNDIATAGNLLIDTFLGNLCPNQDFSQCVGLTTFITSMQNVVTNFATVINMLADLFNLVAEIGTAVYTAARQSNAMLKFGVATLAAFSAFRDSVSGHAFASFAQQQNNFEVFSGFQSADVQYINDTFASWKLFTADAPICPDMLCRNPASDGMMYFSMINATHVDTMMLGNGMRVPKFSVDNSRSSVLDIMTTTQIQVFATQAAAAFNAFFVNVLPVVTQVTYFGMDIFKLLAVLFIIILIPFLKPLAMLLLLLYYVFGQPSASGATVYVPSADTQAFLSQYVESAVANYIKKYATQMRVYLLNRDDVPGPVELKQFLLGVLSVLDTIVSLPSQIALLVAQVADKAICIITHLFPCLKLGEVCIAFFANPYFSASPGKTGFFDWVFILARWAQQIVLDGCLAITGGTCPCDTCKADPNHGILWYITIPGTGWPCVPDHSVSGQSCCVGSSIIHWIPPVGYGIFGITYNGTLPSDVMFALARDDMSALMKFASVM